MTCWEVIQLLHINFLFFSAEAHDRISHKVSIIVPMIPIRGRPGRTQNETTNTQTFKQACACEGGQWGEEVSSVPFTGPSTHKLSAATERLDAKLTKLADKPSCWNHTNWRKPKEEVALQTERNENIFKNHQLHFDFSVSVSRIKWLTLKNSHPETWITSS